MSCTFMKRWTDHYEETGNVDDKLVKGKSHRTSKSVVHAVFRLILSGISVLFQ